MTMPIAVDARPCIRVHVHPSQRNRIASACIWRCHAQAGADTSQTCACVRWLPTRTLYVRRAGRPPCDIFLFHKAFAK